MTRAWFRGVHALHRFAGGCFALLMASWFASGSVMLFARYPELTEAERVRQAEPLSPASAVALPPELAALIDAGGLQAGSRIRLSQLEGEATWTYSTAEGERRAMRAAPPWTVAALDGGRARREAERRVGAKSARVSVLRGPDQWTVGRSSPGDYPLLRVEFDDAERTQAYLAAASGEIVQQSTRSERFWCWLGAIPHWIYPVGLRQARGAWRTLVLALACAGLVVALSGLIAGVHARWVSRSRGTRNPLLAWHQRLGLGFGALASTWLASGALSLSPFGFGGQDPPPELLAQLHDASDPHDSRRVSRALARCQAEGPVHALELAALSGRLLAVCSAPSAETRVIDLGDPGLTPRARLPLETFREAALTLTGGHTSFDLEARTDPDPYYYDTHAGGAIARPYVRLQLADDAHTALYLDPARASVLAYVTDAHRLERWFFHLPHSWDIAALYAHPTLWRAWMLACMLCGLTLSALGLAMFARKRLK